MTLHRGKVYQSSSVSLEPPNPELIRATFKAEDVKASAEEWLEDAIADERVTCFAVCEHGKVVGQVLLHDINEANGEALVAYGLFEPAQRGRGIGTGMLRLLQAYVREETYLETLFIITSSDNLASQRLAQKCGFSYVGASREDPVHGMVFEWHVPRSTN